MLDRSADDRLMRRLDLWIAAVVKARYGVVLAAVALTLASLWLAQRNLRIDSDTSDMISPEAPFRRNAADFDRAFPHLDDTLVIVIDGEAPEAVEQAVIELMETLRVSPHFHEIFRPDAADFFRRYGLLYLDGTALDDLANRLAEAEPLLATLAEEPSLVGLFEALTLALENDEEGEGDALLASVIDEIATVARAQAAGRPKTLSWRRLLSLDELEGEQPRRFVIARPKFDHGTFIAAEAAIEDIRARARNLGLGAENGLRVRLTGSAALEREEMQSAKDGSIAAAWLSLVLVALLLGFGLRSLRLVLATVVTLLMGLVWTAGFAALAIGHINLISVAFAVLFVGLAVDFSIHYCLRYREEGELDGDPEAAVRRAGRGVGRSLAISAAGAGIGFYAFLPTDYRGFAELGLISGSSMFIALAANFTVLPALLAILRPRFRTASSRRGAWQPLERLVTRHYRATLVASVILGGAALALVPAVGFDFNPMNLKDPASESFSTFQDLARSEDSAVYAADVLVSDLDAARRLAASLAALDVVAKTRTLASFVPEAQEEKLEIIDEMTLFLAPLLNAPAKAVSDPSRLEWALDDFQERTRSLDGGGGETRPALRRLHAALDELRPDAGGLIELDTRLTQYLPMLLRDLAATLDARALTLDDLPEAIRRHWVGVDGRHRVVVFPTEDLGDSAAMGRFSDAVLAIAPGATGTPIIVSEASGVIVMAFLQATIVALAAIAVLLLVLYRRVVFVLLTLLPLALAALLTLAAAALLGLHFNFANVIVLPLLFGLGVASSVHLVERRRQLGNADRLMRTTTPRAVLFSTLTTLASFGSLAISAHRGMSSMGQLLTVAIVSTLICTLVVLPSLMPALARWLPVGGAPVADSEME